MLLLNGTPPPRPPCSCASSSFDAFEAEPRAADGPIVVPLMDVERGDYFVRVQVDGAESPLDLDPRAPTSARR